MGLRELGELLTLLREKNVAAFEQGPDGSVKVRFADAEPRTSPAQGLSDLIAQEERVDDERAVLGLPDEPERPQDWRPT